MKISFVRVRILGKFVGSDDAYEKLLPAELCDWLKHEHEGEDGDHHKKIFRISLILLSKRRRIVTEFVLNLG